MVWLSDGGKGTPAAAKVRFYIEFVPSPEAAQDYSFSGSVSYTP
jgi:hypothetical protein